MTDVRIDATYLNNIQESNRLLRQDRDHRIEYEARLRVALEFYADSAQYFSDGPSKWYPLIGDSGRVAREALGNADSNI